MCEGEGFEKSPGKKRGLMKRKHPIKPLRKSETSYFQTFLIDAFPEKRISVFK